MPDSSPATRDLVDAARAGDRVAVDRLFTLAYDELRALARSVRRSGASETMNTTVLVHEAYAKLAPAGALPIADRAHFALIVARAMRQILVDAARRKGAAKRGGDGVAVTFEPGRVPAPYRSDQIIALEEALEELESVDPRRASVVVCRFYGGLDVQETAAALDVSEATVKRDWRVARAWLSQALG